MKFLRIIKILILICIILKTENCLAQNPVNWTSKQLMAPAALADEITTKKDLPVIISVGPGAPIPNSIDNGLVNNKEGLDKFKAQLQDLPRDKKVVIYCGCCPFEHCPNARPAVEALKTMKITNYFLLDLAGNIKKDWIDKGYPVTKN